MLSNSFADYLAAINDVLRASPFVHEFTTQYEDRGEVLFLRVNVCFIDNSLLHFRELFVYHYQHADGTIVFRYDNAPYHKHLGENEGIAAHPPDLQAVLNEIEAAMDKN